MAKSDTGDVSSEDIKQLVAAMKRLAKEVRELQERIDKDLEEVRTYILVEKASKMFELPELQPFLTISGAATWITTGTTSVSSGITISSANTWDTAQTFDSAGAFSNLSLKV